MQAAGTSTGSQVGSHKLGSGTFDKSTGSQVGSGTFDKWGSDKWGQAPSLFTGLHFSKNRIFPGFPPHL